MENDNRKKSGPKNVWGIKKREIYKPKEDLHQKYKGIKQSDSRVSRSKVMPMALVTLREGMHREPGEGGGTESPKHVAELTLCYNRAREEPCK